VHCEYRHGITPIFQKSLLACFLAGLLALGGCSNDENCPTGPGPQTTRDITVADAEYGPFCATYISGGDTDFGGNGPQVALLSTVYVSGDSLMFSFFVEATETQSNWTKGRGGGAGLLYQAPAGWRISSDDTLFTVVRFYTDTNHEMDFILSGDVNFRGYGDCAGNDIGAGCVCTRYWVWIRDIHLRLVAE